MVDPGEFVGGAGLGTGLSMLCTVLIDFIQKTRVFRSHFKDIERILQQLETVSKQMSDSNKELPYPEGDELEGLKKVLMNGKDLVDKCSKIEKWNLVKKYRYGWKLTKWEEDFQKERGTVGLLGIRDGKRTSVAVENVRKEVKNLKDSTVKIEVSTKKVEVTTQKLDARVHNLTEDVNNMKVPIGNIEVSTGKIEDSIGNIEVSNKKIEGMFENWSKKMEVNQMVVDVFKPALPPHPVGLDGPLKELKEKLLNNNGLSKLVLTGPAGCGKTTLVSMFCRDQEVKDIFKDNIIFLTFSKDRKLDSIVQQLYQHKGRKVPTFTDAESLVHAESLVQTFIKEEGKRPLLLVLDGVWSRSGSLLQMFKLEESQETLDLDYKVLVTSRSRFKAFASTLDVKLLDDKEAMELFSHFASLGNSSSPSLKDVAKQVVDKCEGLPIALKMIGLSLRGECEPVWRTKLSRWSGGSSSILETDIQLLRWLRSSIDDLYEVTRKCFLDFALFPQSKYIPVATLFDMWAELYGLHGDNECIEKLLELSSRSLAKFVDGREVTMEADGYYSQHFVIQHGLLRELAIYISKQAKIPEKVLNVEDRKRLIIDISEGDHPKWWGKQKTMEARRLSISTDEKFSKEWPSIQFPKAKVLVLFFRTQEYVLPEFVNEMPELKVLVITCDVNYVLGAALKRWIPRQDQLLNLKTIILEGISIPSITKNPMPRMSVKKISMSRCYGVTEAFSDHPIQISRFFPDLEVMNIDLCYLMELPSDLGSLKSLKVLNITNCGGLSTLPDGMEKLVNLEVLRLRYCRDFSKFQHSIKLEKLKLLDLAYCSSIKELPKDIGELSSLEKLNTRNCPTLNELPQSISDLENLEVVICSSKTKSLTECLPHGKNIRMVAPTLEFDDFTE